MEIKVSVLKDLVEAVGAGGDAIAKVTDGIKHLVATGVEGYDAARARRTYAKMLRLSARLVRLIDDKKALVRRLNAFVRDAPLLTGAEYQERWKKLVLFSLKPAKKRLDAELTVLYSLSDEFVLDPAYVSLVHLLDFPGRALEPIQGMYAAPSTAEELKVIGELADVYARLIVEFERAREEMSAYLKSLKSQKE